MHSRDITLVILCGGTASRMLGVNKPLWPINRDGIRQTMIDHVIAATKDVGSMVISANNHLAYYAQRGAVITDAQVQLTGAGPLAGILAGIRYAQTPWLLVSPADSPYLRSGWHHALQQRADEAPDIEAVVVHDGERLQPLHLLLRTHLESRLVNHLAHGHRSALSWLNSLNTVAVPFADQQQFRNVNSFVDLS